MSAVAVMTLGGTASARPEYPEALQKNLDMPCPPTCMLCHTDPAGGDDKTNQYYGNFYPAAFTPTELNGDADGDGKSDGEELKAGESPILSGPVSICVPEYGCGARVAPAPPNDAIPPEAWLIGTIALGALARFHLRRRAR